MPLPQTIRSFIPLVIGLAIGGAGAVLYRDSMPGPEGSPEERANKHELELKQARNRIAALEAADSGGDQSGWFGSTLRSNVGEATPEPTLKDGLRSLAQDIREGRPVSPEDIFRATKPLMRDLAPLFDRMRVKQQQQMIDSMTGELARKYDLPPGGQAALKQWFERRAEGDAKRWKDLVTHEHTGIEDLMRAATTMRPDEGIENFMPSVLSGEKLAAFQTERLAERAERVQQEADTQVQRLDSIVGLDDAQRDQIFGIMARSSKEYDAAMILEGTRGDIGPTPGGDRQEAMLALLRADQRAAYEVERLRRRDEAAKTLEAMGLSLPPEWEVLVDGFR